ncbi:histidine phosphatase family protein [Candidatus Margulisiibacteriota bacterium]
MSVIPAKFNNLAEAVHFVRKMQLRSRESVAILSRHGQTRYNEAGILQAWRPDDDRLTPYGQQQGQLLRKTVKPFPVTVRIASVSRRARQTIGRALRGQRTIKLGALRDIDFGDLRGMTFAGPGNQFETEHPELFHAWMSFSRDFEIPGGESWRGFEERVAGAAENDVLPRLRGKFGLVVTHMGTSRQLLYAMLGENVTTWRPTVSNAGITIVHFRADSSPSLLLLDNTEHLTDLVDR